MKDYVALVEELPPPPCAMELWLHPINLADGLGTVLVKYNQGGKVISPSSSKPGLHVFQVHHNGKVIWFGKTSVLTAAGVDSNGRAVLPNAGHVYHYALVLESIYKGRTYVNGTDVAKFDLLGKLDFPNVSSRLPWRLGARDSYIAGRWKLDDQCFGGVIDEVRWWSVARDAEQIRGNMHRAVPDDSVGLRRQWRFDAGQGEGDETYFVGGGNPFTAPSWVPSPFEHYGGPVAHVSAVGAAQKSMELCALLTSAAAGATASVEIGAATAPTGTLAPTSGSMSQTPSAAGTRFCFKATHSTGAPGFGEIPFTVTAHLANGTAITARQKFTVRVAGNSYPIAEAACAMYIDGIDDYVSLGSFGLSDNFSIALWLAPPS